MWEGTPCGDCAGRLLGTPRDDDDCCDIVDAYVLPMCVSCDWVEMIVDNSIVYACVLKYDIL